MIARNALVLLFAIACRGTVPGYHATALPLPREDAAASGATEFATCKGALALVPHRGGVVVAGWKRWLLEPKGSPIESVACDESGDLFFIVEHALVMASPDGNETTTPLPEGTWHVVGTADPLVWVYGAGSDGSWAIYRITPGQAPTATYSGPHRVQTIAPIGTNGLVAVIDGELVAWRGAEPEDLGQVGDSIDGLAVSPSGTLYLSGPGGVARMRSLDDPPERVTKAIHGPLQIRGDSLYIWWRANHAIVRLDPVRVHKPRPLGSPSLDRKFSFELGVEYDTRAQTSAIDTQDGPAKMVEKFVLANPLTLQGPTFHFGIGSQHWTFDQELAFLSGSSPIASEMLNTGVGSPIATSNVGVFAMSVLIGRRIPFRYASLRFGTGIAPFFMLADAYKDNAGSLQSYNVVGMTLPAWGRLEWEPRCDIGLFARGGYEVGVGVPSSWSLQAGFVYRLHRDCW